MLRTIMFVLTMFVLLAGTAPLRADRPNPTAACCDREAPCDSDDGAMPGCVVACVTGCVALTSHAIVAAAPSALTSGLARPAKSRFQPGIGAPPATPPPRAN